MSRGATPHAESRDYFLGYSLRFQLYKTTRRADAATDCARPAVDNWYIICMQLLKLFRLYLRSLEPGAIIRAYVCCCIEGLIVFGFARYACVGATLSALRNNEKKPQKVREHAKAP